MLDKNMLVKITNRTKSVLFYIIPDINIKRRFTAGETKEVSVDELLKLSYVEGGRYIIKNCLLVSNQEVLNELLGNSVEPEYFYTEEDIKTKFAALFKAFYYGAPPHAGIAPGVDRMVMLIAGEESIREVITFPMNKNAQDLMMGAPTAVDKSQLDTVHIALIEE